MHVLLCEHSLLVPSLALTLLMERRWAGTLGLNVSEDYIVGAWRVYDVDGNGQLNRDEFLNFM